VIIIRGEKPSEIDTGYDILKKATGDGAEAGRVATLRNTSEFNTSLSLIADVDGKALGYALYYPAVCGTTLAAVLVTLGVLPEAKEQGIDERLVRHGLDRCASLKRNVVFALENTGLFQSVGFQPIAPYKFKFNLNAPQEKMGVIDLSGNSLAKAGGATVHFPAALV
jgi:predicted N-acetyltransferase YhbS